MTRLNAFLATLLWAAASVPLAASAATAVRVSAFEYDAGGMLVREIVEPDSPQDCLRTTTTYDTWGNPTSQSSAVCTGATGYTVQSAGTARTTSAVYAAHTVTAGGYSYNVQAGLVATQTTNALGQSEQKEYDPRFGAVVRLTGPNGLVTTWSYDEFGRKTRETRADGTYSTWDYLLCSQTGANCPGALNGVPSVWVAIERQLQSNGNVNGPEKRQFHDALGRVLRVQTQGFDGAGAAPTLVQDTQYDPQGQIQRQSNTYVLGSESPVWTSYTYDVLGRVTEQRQPDPAAAGGVAITTMAYNGLTRSVTNSKGQIRTTVNNPQGQPERVTDALGSHVRYTYDPLGQLVRTDAGGIVSTISYSQRGHKTGIVDPVAGVWDYAHNAFGELVWQRDSLGRTFTIAYDRLGRVTRRVEPDLISDWSYDRKFDGSACGAGVGKLCEARANNGYNRAHTYDARGRLASTATVLDNPVAPAVESVAYDTASGRVLNQTWPTGYRATYAYSALGYLRQVTGGGVSGHTQTATYEVLAMNARGQITQYRHGNGVTTTRTFDNATDRLSQISATLTGQGVGNVLRHTYSHDSLGNVLARNDLTPGVGTTEGFTYDSLNRLTGYTIGGGGVSPPQATQVMYNARGDITYKSDVGQYYYDVDRPGRLVSVALSRPASGTPLTGTRGLVHAYDDQSPGARSIGGVTIGNGNLLYTVSQDQTNNRHNVRWETYTSFNMPSEIRFGSLLSPTNPTNTVADRTLSFVYGPEHQRIRQQVQLSGNGTSSYFAGTTWYLHGPDGQSLSYEKEVRNNGTTEHKHYVSAGGVSFVLYTSRSGTLNGLPATSRSYLHHDHLGSVAAVTNEAGQVIERLAYDPWGKRRFPDGRPDLLDAIVGNTTDRGYTMHEHLDEVGIIHMNGRVYDPLVARFMSADPFIQHIDNLQSHNRYAYVLNNPLAFTDPSGYFSFKKLFKKVFRIAVAVAAAYYLGGAGGAEFALFSGGSAGGMSAAVAAVANGAAAGFVSGVVLSGSIEGGLQGALTGAVFAGIGEWGAAAKWGKAGSWGAAKFVSAHAVGGCVTSAAFAGKCGQGAMAAGFAKFATLQGPQFQGNHAAILNGVKATVVGGTTSVLGGGKFENGANTAAFIYLLSTASEYYEHAVGRKANPIPGINDPRETTYDFDTNGRQLYSSHKNNVIGINQPLSGNWLEDIDKQGGLISKALNVVPTMNATAALHDYWFNNPDGLKFTPISNFGTMLPAASISIGAVVGNYTRGNEPMLSMMYHMDSRRRDRRGD